MTRSEALPITIYADADQKTRRNFIDILNLGLLILKGVSASRLANLFLGSVIELTIHLGNLFLSETPVPSEARSFAEHLSLAPLLKPRAIHSSAGHSETFHQPISSTPFRIAPTTADVCIASLAPLDTLCSISASVSSQLIMTCGLTSNFVTSSDSAVIMSASARPCATFNVLIVDRHDVTSLVLSNVSRIFLIASGGGAATQLYIVSVVMVSRTMSFSAILGPSRGCSGVPILSQHAHGEQRKPITYSKHGMPAARSMRDACHPCLTARAHRQPRA